MPTELLNKLRKVAANPTRELKPVKPKNETIGYERRENTDQSISTDSKLPQLGGKGGWASNWNLGKIDDTFRTITVNPLIRSLMIGGLIGGGTWLAGPMIGRLSRSMFGTPQQHDEYGNPVDITASDRRNLALLTGLGAAGLSAAVSFDSKRPFWSLWKYPEKRSPYATQPIQKKAYVYGREDLIPLSMAKETILGNPKLTNEMKARSLDVLNMFPEQKQSVNSYDIVNKAVQTGLSGLTGYALGYVTASAIGLKDPADAGKAAGIMGVLSSTLLH